MPPEGVLVWRIFLGGAGLLFMLMAIFLPQVNALQTQFEHWLMTLAK